MTISSIIDTLEESKLSGVKRTFRVQASAGVLNSDMRVTDDVALRIKVLWRGVVSRCSVGESARVDIHRLYLNGKVLIGGKIGAVLGVHEDG